MPHEPPETQRLYATRQAAGLVVMGVDAEPKTKLLEFVGQNKYTFPVYHDKLSAASTAFGANPSHTRRHRQAGHLSSYFVGLQEPATVEAALKKAGL